MADISTPVAMNPSTRPMARGGYTTFELGVLIVVFTLIKLVLIEPG
jgi:hypothetical protein